MKNGSKAMNITKVEISSELLAEALMPLEDRITQIEAANAGAEVSRLMMEYGPKGASNER